LDDFSDEYDDCLTSLIDLADQYPKILRAVSADILATSLSLIVNEEIEDDVRHSYVELIITLCERAPGMMKKLPAIHDFVVGLFQMLADLSEEDDWKDHPDNEELDDDNENYAIAEQALDRISCSLEGKSLLNTFMTIIPSLLAQAEWKRRHAGLMAIACIAEGCKELLSANLPAVLQ
jgi:hypothetical protein